MIGLPRAAAEILGVPHGLEEQHVAVDAGIIERCRADFAEREIDLVAHGNEAGKSDAARFAPRHERSDEVATVRGGKDAPGRQIRLVEGGVRRQHGARAQVDDAEARWSDDAEAGARAGLAQPRLARRTFGARFRETVGQYGCDLDAETAALLDRRNGSFRRRHDVGVLGRLGQCGERRPGALAEHGFAPRIDRIDAARIADPPQKFQRPPGGFGRIVRLSDDGDGAGREE